MNILTQAPQPLPRPMGAGGLGSDSQQDPATLRPGHRGSRLIGWLACTLVATSAAAAGGGPSGVQGAVTLSPSCGGAQREGDACTAPYAGVEVRLVGDGGTVAASARTSPAGRFVLPSPPGRYRVQVMTGSKITRCPLLDVVVTAQVLSRVDVECDSGMR